MAWASQISPATMVDILANRAQGVFLWVKLALDELDTLPMNAQTAEIISLINGFPADLEEFYNRTICRIPPHARLRAYTLLELVHKSKDLLTHEDIVGAEACANGTTFESCRRLLLRHRQHMTVISSGPSQLKEEESVRSDIKTQHTAGHPGQAIQVRSTENPWHLLNLCGGLLECVGTASFDSESSSNIDIVSRRHPYVQFIHRTVRDFVGKSGFSALILGRRHLLQTENGYSFLLKYHCVSDTIIHNPDDKLLRLAQAHEKTTGRASAKFLDSLPISFFEVLDLESIYASAGHTSNFLLGAVAGLQLYLQPYFHPDRIRETRTTNPRVINVLAWNVSRRARDRRSEQEPRVNVLAWNFDRRPRDRRSDQEPRLKVPHNDTYSSSNMVKTLLAHGFSSTDTLFGFSPFETIFCRAHPESSVTGESTYTPEMIEFAETLIQVAGQDPDVLLHSRKCKHSNSDGRVRWGMVIHRKRCAIHVSYGGMMSMLLRNGANPNLQDSNGNTALDVCIGTERNVFDFGVPWSQQEVYSTTMILLDHGAKLTSRGAILRPTLIKLMSEYDPSLDISRLKDVEILDLPVQTSDIRSYEYFLNDGRRGHHPFLQASATITQHREALPAEIQF